MGHAGINSSISPTNRMVSLRATTIFWQWNFCQSQVSQISYITTYVLEAHYGTAVSLLNGMPEGHLEARDALQFSGRFVLFTFLQAG
jgi:hypothetical protein